MEASGGGVLQKHRKNKVGAVESRILPAPDEKCLSAFAGDEKKNPKYLEKVSVLPRPSQEVETARVLF
jgi:hypothetical protein